MGMADEERSKGLAADDTVFVVAVWEVLGHVSEESQLKNRRVSE